MWSLNSLSITEQKGNGKEEWEKTSKGGEGPHLRWLHPIHKKANSFSLNPRRSRKIIGIIKRHESNFLIFI